MRVQVQVLGRIGFGWPGSARHSLQLVWDGRGSKGASSMSWVGPLLLASGLQGLQLRAAELHRACNHTCVCPASCRSARVPTNPRFTLAAALGEPVKVGPCSIVAQA